MEKFKLIVGVSALCLLFSFNLRHALNDYGVSDPNNQLHPQVYAQTNTAGNNGTTNVVCACGGFSGNMPICHGHCHGGTPVTPGTGWGPAWERKDLHCEFRFSGRAGATITVRIGVDLIALRLNSEGEASFEIRYGRTDCRMGGWQQCEARYCPQSIFVSGG